MRRTELIKMLEEANQPVKGADLAKHFAVSRQVIVQDIALLRAEGSHIIATPQGYILQKEVKEVWPQQIIVTKHSTIEAMKDELETIVMYGGHVLNVIVEHPIYGEIMGNLSLTDLYEVEEFIQKVEEHQVSPLSFLTNGVHLHTIAAKNEAILEKIMHKLSGKDYLIKAENMKKET